MVSTSYSTYVLTKHLNMKIKKLVKYENKHTQHTEQTEQHTNIQQHNNTYS